jgi:hypothetical protein
MATEALKNNTTVNTVTVGNNKIGDSGCAALVEALKVNTTVKQVYLHGNVIGDAGCAALAEALKVNTTVIRVSLNRNKIGDEGSAALVEALKMNTVIELDVFEGMHFFRWRRLCSFSIFPEGEHCSHIVASGWYQHRCPRLCSIGGGTRSELQSHLK